MGQYQRGKRRQAPFRICQGCGGGFRSWREDRYCSRARCREDRLGPADGESFRETIRRRNASS